MNHPNVIYMAREKIPGKPHHFKAGVTGLEVVGLSGDLFTGHVNNVRVVHSELIAGSLGACDQDYPRDQMRIIILDDAKSATLEAACNQLATISASRAAMNWPAPPGKRLTCSRP
jgi:hypothetical protein